MKNLVFKILVAIVIIGSMSGCVVIPLDYGPVPLNHKGHQ